MTGARWRWVIGWAVLIEVLVLWPSPPLLPKEFSSMGIDKLVHAGLFAVQAALTAGALGRHSRRWWLLLAVVILFGAFTEFEQHFIPSRSMGLGDLLADAAGAIVGLVVFAVWAPRRQESHR